MLSISSLNKLENFFAKVIPTPYKRGDILLYPEESPTNIFYIKSGFVRSYSISEQGEELTLAILKSKDFFPLTCGINNAPNNHFFEALTSLEVWRVPKEEFLNFVKQNPEVFYELTNDILSRFGGLLTRMEYLIVSHAYTKVATTLLIMAKRFGQVRGSEVVVSVPLTHKDIATLAGITRETTCLEMKKLQDKGLISRSGRLFVVKNLKGLEEESLLDKTEQFQLEV